MLTKCYQLPCQSGHNAFPQALRANICCGLKCNLWEVVVDISVAGSLVAVAKAKNSMEKVGSTIISPFWEVMLLMLALEGGEDECLAALPLLMIVLPVLPTLAHVAGANACFCKQFRGCCVARELSRPETGATVFVFSFMCSLTFV